MGLPRLPGLPDADELAPRPDPVAGLPPVQLLPAPWRAAAARHPRLVDAGVAVAVQFVGMPTTLLAHPRPWAWLVDVALVLPLIWRRRAPMVVFGVLVAAAAVQWGVGLRLGVDVALLVALYTVAAYRPRPWAVAAAVVLEIGVVFVSVWFRPARGVAASLIFLTGLAAAAFFIGTTVQNRRAYLGTLVDRARWLERERDQQARLVATAERARIARELHDIVAHSLTVVVTLAEAAAVASATDPPAARTAMSQVATTGRTALAEMRRLLGVLRADPADPTDPDDPRTRAPAPGIDRVDELVANARAAGLPVRLTVTGRPRPLPTTLDVTAYRIVQESLTNALRHTVDPTAVHVLLRWAEAELVVEVTDDGRPNGPHAAGGGHGLGGMRERLALFGGTLSTGPGPLGGWAVQARLPLSGDPLPGDPR